MTTLVWLFLAVAWGLTWLAVRIGLEDLPPITFAGIRFLVAALLLLLVLLLRRRVTRQSRADWLLIAQTAILTIALPYALQFWGQQYVSSGLAAVMFATVPLFTMLLAHIQLPAEPLNRVKMVGVLTGIVGVALIFSDQLQMASILAALGCAGFLIGALSMASAQVIIKSRGGHIDPLLLATCQMGTGGVLLFSAGVGIEGAPSNIVWTSRAALALAYLAVVGSAIAFSLLYWLLQRMTVTRVSAMGLAHPVVAVLAGWAVLSETLSLRAIGGAVCVLIGLALVLGKPSSLGRPLGLRRP